MKREAAEINSLTNRLNSININDLNSQAAAARNQASTLSSQVSAANASQNSAQSSYDAAANQLRNVNNNLSAQQSLLSRIENELSSQISTNAYATTNLSNIRAQEAELAKTEAAVNNIWSGFTYLTNNFIKTHGQLLNTTTLVTETLPVDQILSTEALKEACKTKCNSDFDKIMSAVGAANINMRDAEGKTMLMHSIAAGFWYGVDKLLKANADVNIKDNQDKNALIYASNVLHLKHTKTIIDRTNPQDINIKVKDATGNTALHHMITNSNSTLRLSEIVNEIDVSKCMFMGNNAMEADIPGFIIGAISTSNGQGYTTCYDRTFRIMRHLIERGANINSTDNFGQTPFFIACLYRLKYISDQLIANYSDKIDFTIKTSNNDTAIHYAAISGNVDLAKFIIDRKVCNVNDVNGGGRTPLLSAVACLNKDMIEYLLSKGADINKCDNNQASPLYYSLGYNNNFDINIVKYLIDHGADVNKPMFDGDTPMHMVGYKANIAAMKMLISKGANINVINTEGKTPLHVLMDRTEISSDLKLIAIKFFLSYKARVDIVDNQGHTSIDLAKQHFPQAVQWLEHPETVPSTNQLESSYTNDIVSTSSNLSETSSNNNSNNIANANNHPSYRSKNKDGCNISIVDDLLYDNKLLNNFDLLIKAAKFGNFKVSEALNSSFNLNSDLVNQAINDDNYELILAGLISLN